MTSHLPVEIMCLIFSFYTSLILKSRILNSIIKKYCVIYLDIVEIQFIKNNHAPDFRNIHVSHMILNNDDLVLLSKTKKLSLFRCCLSESISYDYLKNVESISYILGDIDKYTLNHFSNVVKLDISYTSVTSEDLEKIKNVKILTMTNCCKITDTGFEHLGNVQKLSVSKCGIIGSGFKYLKNVKDLDVSECDIKGKWLKDLPILDRFDMSSCILIQNKDMKYLSRTGTLIMNNTYVTNIGVKYLTHVSNINMKMCLVNGHNFVKLSCCKVLDVSYCSRIEDEDLKYLSGVSILNLKYCTNITDDGLKYLKKVEILNAENCDKITNIGLQCLKKLRILSISNCSVNNEGLKYLKNIDKLYISRCNITNEGIKNLSELHSVYISKCEMITDKSLKYIPKVNAYISYDKVINMDDYKF